MSPKPRQPRRRAWWQILWPPRAFSHQPPGSSNSSNHQPRLFEATTRQLPRIRQLARLVRLTARLPVRYFNASHATVYVEDPSASAYRLMAHHGTRPPPTIRQVEADSPLIRWLWEHRKVLRAEECPAPSKAKDPYRRLRLTLENLVAELIVPSFHGKRLLGFLVLGKRALHTVTYTDEEVVALSRLAQSCAIALNNARSYEELRTTAQKLHSAQERLVRQERMVAAGRLALGLAHEIKNPLAAIKTFVEFLPDRYDDPAFRQEFTQVVGKEVERINQTVQSLSDFARPMLLKLETLDVQQILKENVALLSNDCLKRGIAIQQAFEPEQILIPTDANQLTQAFLNLCMNALEAMERGGTLSVSCRYEAGEAVIRIADTGVGIPKEHLPALFDPFFTTKESGMGLGLAVVKQIVEQHLGSIRVESQPGAGSTFEIRLPLAVKFTPGMARSGEGGWRRDDEVVEAVPLDLLVVDDEPKIQALLKETFEMKGCRVRTSASGQEALALVEESMPQLMLLDLKLQDLDGFEVLKQVKMRHPLLPVIVITGSFDEGIDRYVRELGALACLHKPLDLRRLQRCVFETARSLARQHAPVKPEPGSTTASPS